MLIFDIEIQKAIAKNGEERLAGVEYCAGFEDFNNMGVAVLCCYTYADDRYHVFGECELDDFQALLKQNRVIIGYNSINFDCKLLAAHDVEIQPERNYDLMREVSLVTGAKFLKLDALAEANGAGKKTESGALAPILWQRGEHTRVINYCLNDVRITKSLIDRLIRKDFLYSPDKQVLFVRKPGSY